MAIDAVVVGSMAHSGCIKYVTLTGPRVGQTDKPIEENPKVGSLYFYIIISPVMRNELSAPARSTRHLAPGISLNIDANYSQISKIGWLHLSYSLFAQITGR